jgi:hypothetical protein
MIFKNLNFYEPIRELREQKESGKTKNKRQMFPGTESMQVVLSQVRAQDGVGLT